MRVPKLAMRVWRMCLRKQRYPRPKALSVAAAINKQEGRLVVHAYCCPRCRRWHVGGIGRWSQAGDFSQSYAGCDGNAAQAEDRMR